MCRCPVGVWGGVRDESAPPRALSRRGPGGQQLPFALSLVGSELLTQEHRLRVGKVDSGWGW